MMRRIVVALTATACALSLAACGQAEKKHAQEQGEEEHREGFSNSVRLTPEAVARSGIEIGQVNEISLTGGVDAPAELQLDPDRTAHITPLVSGRIEEVRAVLGQKVKKNDALLKLRSVTLGQARADIAQARAAVDVAQAAFSRQEELEREGIGARRAFLEARADLRKAKAELSAAIERVRVYSGRGGSGSITWIRSPLDGTVIERHATPGEVIHSERPVFVIADLARVWVVGRLYEQDVYVARLGAPAIITLPAYPGRVWEGNVSYVASTLDPHTRTLPIRVELDNPDGLLRPGLFGTLSLSPGSEARQRVVAVPESAIQQVNGQSVVFVPGTDTGSYSVVPVTVGVRVRGQAEILSGLESGDHTVISGAFTLKSELMRAQLAEGHEH